VPAQSLLDRMLAVNIIQVRDDIALAESDRSDS
jgi:hypothetical protein